MQANRILKHSFLQLTGNWRHALAITWLPFLLQSATLFLILDRVAGRSADESFNGIFLLLVAVFLFTSLWIAVAWHRYVLLNERGHLFSGVKAAFALRYAKTGLFIGLLMVPVLFAVVVPLAGFMAWTNSRLDLRGPISFLAFWIILSVLLRLSVALPGAAVGASKPIATAWRAMKRTTGMILALGFFLALSQWAIDEFVLKTIDTVFGLFGYIPVQIVLYWFWTLFGLSILTTLYGHFVENRPLR